MINHHAINHHTIIIVCRTGTGRPRTETGLHHEGTPALESRVCLSPAVLGKETAQATNRHQGMHGVGTRKSGAGRGWNGEGDLLEVT
jgi:hypothetical protein